MAVYKVAFTEEYWQEVEIEADSYESAARIFHSGDFDWDKVVTVGGPEIQEQIDIIEVEEAE